jgi:FkbM family methyltransferase
MAMYYQLKQQLTRIPYHIRYLSYAAGRRLLIGDQSFRMKGYFPNKFALEQDWHEPNLIPVIRRLLANHPGAFVDIGTNVGQTLCKVLAIDRNRRYFGFEPLIACCFYLDQFIKENRITTAQVFPVALAESTGFASLYTSGDADSMASLDDTSLRPTEFEHTTVIVPTFRGDEALRGLDSISVIKIDVEGAELNVLRGLADIMGRLKPAVIFEVLPNFKGDQRTMLDRSVADVHNERAKTIFALFAGLGYSIHQIDEEGQTNQIQAFSLDDPVNYIGSNYVALHGARSGGMPRTGM